MKTNVSIDLTDAERNRLKMLIDGKVSKKLISRKEVNAIAQQHFAGLLGITGPLEIPPKPAPTPGRRSVEDQRADAKRVLFDSMTKPDPEDVAIMARPHDPGYCFGWNKVKRGAA